MENKQDFIDRMEALNNDHFHDGWPAVQMRDINSLLEIIYHLQSHIISEWPAGGYVLSIPKSGMHFHNGTEIIGSPGRYYFKDKRDAINSAFCECTELYEKTLSDFKL